MSSSSQPTPEGRPLGAREAVPPSEAGLGAAGSRWDHSLIPPSPEAAVAFVRNLPEHRGTIPEKPRLVPRFGLVHFQSAGDILVAADRLLDPALDSWLERHCPKSSQSLTPEAQLKCLTDLVGAVRDTFRFTGGSILHRTRNAQFAELQRREREGAVLLGDFIANGTGVCRHAAVLLQSACQHSGVATILQTGVRKEVDQKTGASVGVETAHAWQLAAIGHSAYVIDPLKGMIWKFETWSAGAELTSDTLVTLYSKREIFGKTRGRFGFTDSYSYRPDRSELSFLRPLGTSLAREFVETAFRLSTQSHHSS